MFRYLFTSVCLFVCGTPPHALVCIFFLILPISQSLCPVATSHLSFVFSLSVCLSPLCLENFDLSSLSCCRCGISNFLCNMCRCPGVWNYTSTRCTYTSNVRDRDSSLHGVGGWMSCLLWPKNRGVTRDTLRHLSVFFLYIHRIACIHRLYACPRVRICVISVDFRKDYVVEDGDIIFFKFNVTNAGKK